MRTNSKELADSWNDNIYFKKSHCIKFRKDETFSTFYKTTFNGEERLFVVTDKNVYELLVK